MKAPETPNAEMTATEAGSSGVERRVMQHLEALGEGLHPCGWLKGWITVERKGAGWEVMWCTGKTTHDPLRGPAVSVEFVGDGVGSVYKSALSMWPVPDEAERQRWAGWMEQKIKQAAKRAA